MKSVLLIGMNHFGIMLARQLYTLGHEILAVDRDEEKINAVLPIVTDAQIQEKFLLRNGADEVINPSRQAAEWTVARYEEEWKK